MKFKELPEEMQVSLLKGRKKARVTACILWSIFFAIITVLLFIVGHGFEYLSVLSVFCVLVGLIKLPVEKNTPFDCQKNIESFNDCSFSDPSASESD